MSWSRCWMLVLIVIASCTAQRPPPPSPLGTLTVWQLPLWQAECSTPLAWEKVCGRFPPERCDAIWHSIEHVQAAIVERDRGASATLKLTCASEGWGVWKDDLHRIVGLCTAHERGTDESERLLQFVRRHSVEADARRISDFIRRSTGEPSPGVWSWFEDWNMVPKPATMGKQACFEVRLPRS